MEPGEGLEPPRGLAVYRTAAVASGPTRQISTKDIVPQQSSACQQLFQKNFVEPTRGVQPLFLTYQVSVVALNHIGLEPGLGIQPRSSRYEGESLALT